MEVKQLKLMTCENLFLNLGLLKPISTKLDTKHFESCSRVLSMGEVTRDEKKHECLFSLETSPKLFSFQRQFKKLENSMCLVSYSMDYVEKYHVPLAKSLMEYSNRKDLRIKRAIIREPENLNSIPPSKVCINDLFCLR